MNSDTLQLVTLYAGKIEKIGGEAWDLMVQHTQLQGFIGLVFASIVTIICIIVGILVFKNIQKFRVPADGVMAIALLFILFVASASGIYQSYMRHNVPEYYVIKDLFMNN